MVELEVLGVSPPEENQFPLVFLRHGNRVLPIIVGLYEANAIQMGLAHERTARPMTHDLISNLLAGLRGDLKSVTIYRLENDTFYAHLNVEQRSPEGHVEQILRIDSRPSDGIAIAVRIGCPIYCAEEVLELAGQDAASLGNQDVAHDDEDDDETDASDEPF